MTTEHGGLVTYDVGFVVVHDLVTADLQLTMEHGDWPYDIVPPLLCS